ncbi:MAG: alpha-1,2-fucosyltransferase [Lachnospiraceae bacterium]|nr:alpha-1,2-fucosyltransferase [Lachnospiraceae bacterium]
MMQRVMVKVYGGLGNQLFCYACGYAVAKYNNCDLVIDTSQQDNDSFRKVDILNFKIIFSKRITFKKGTNLLYRAIINHLFLLSRIGLRTTIIKERECYKYDSEIFHIGKKNVYLKGYWQNHQYFEKYREDLLHMFFPAIEVSDYGKKMQNKINSCEKSVAIHIRRGDYLSIGCSIGQDYYDLAIKYMEKALVNNITYVIFSDDILFAEEFRNKNKKLDMLVINNLSDHATVEDLFLMSKCRHQIIANSSYSWWAAWLNTNHNKVVICPEVKSWEDDFYPENWIRIQAEVCKYS